MDSIGMPHNTSIKTSEVTDILTSRPIDLSTYTGSSNVVLSFYWQKKGNSDDPEGATQKFALYFRDTAGWNNEQIWEVIGIETETDSVFHFESQLITDARYLHDCFQFRFESTGSTGGQFDVWNLDYVYLNSDRTDNLDQFEDLTVVTPPSSIFSPYTMVPFDQLGGFGSNLFENISFDVRNLRNTIEPVQYNYTLTQRIYNADSTYTDEDLYVLDASQSVVNPGGVATVNVPALDITDLSGLRDSTLLLSKATFITNDINEFQSNDQSIFQFRIGEALAYDDGTAELSAGFSQAGVKLAILYTLAVEDTLTHIDIFFPRVGTLPNNNRFQIAVASSLEENDSIFLAQQEFSRPVSASGINEFTRFEFDDPSHIPGDFYVIYTQSASTDSPIGLDVNTRNGDKIFLNYGSGWEPNDLALVDGSLMIRPGFGVVVEDTTTLSLPDHELVKTPSVYPNPATNLLQISGEYDHWQLIDLSGKIHLAGTNRRLDISRIPTGMYLLKFSLKGQNMTRKVLIRR